MRHSPCLILVLAGLLQACQTSSAPPKVTLSMPSGWNIAQTGQATSSVGKDWWTLFHDPALNALVQQGLERNHDIRIAASNIDIYLSRAALADANLYPYASLDVSRQRIENSQRIGSPFVLPVRNTTRIALNASYELDIWGKYRAASAAAQAQVLATKAAYDSVRLSLTAAIAQSYYSLLATDQQAILQQEILQNRQNLLALVKLRQRSGLSFGLDVQRGEVDLSSAQARLSNVLRAQKDLVTSLALLTGRSAEAITGGQLVRGQTMVSQPLWVPDNLPSTLLLSRPDIRQAEQVLVAQQANIAAARANIFPAITLTSTWGSESHYLRDLFSGPAGIFQFIVGMTQTIFDGGRVRSITKIAEAQREAAVAEYKKTVAQAFTDVQKALAWQSASHANLQAAIQAVNAAQNTEKLVQLRLQQGMANQTDILNAQYSLLEQQVIRLEAQAAQQVAVVGLFKALGGGWEENAHASLPKP